MFVFYVKFFIDYFFTVEFILTLKKFFVIIAQPHPIKFRIKKQAGIIPACSISVSL